jgi:hypothetical protein
MEVPMSTLEQIMNNHRIRLVAGVPDHRVIRKIEAEIYGEPVSEYPGEWDGVTQDDHLQRHVRGSGRYRSYDYYAPRCLWCEDRRRDREAIEVQVRAEHEAMSRMTRGQLIKEWFQIHGLTLIIGFLVSLFIFSAVMAFLAAG